MVVSPLVIRPNHRAPASPSWLGRVVSAVVLLMVAAAVAMPALPVAAHAALDESDPASNAVIASAPTQITLRYTEPLERSYSRAELYDQTGNAVSGALSEEGADEYSMVIPLPNGLPNGTYTVMWRTLSTADGHTAQGYFAFTVGSQADVVSVVPPVTATTESGGPPDWLRGVSRWLALLGVAAAIAIWPVWLLVLRPAISPAWQAGPDMARRAKDFAAAAIVFAILGSVVALLVQADAVAGDEGFFDSISTTLGTRYGTYWQLRIGLLLVYAAILMACAWWWPRRQPVVTALALVAGAALPIPFSMVSHAAAQPAGKDTAIAFDAVHLLGASLWVGGLFVLLAVLVPTLRDLTAAGKRAVLARALPRFSALALGAWAVLGLTGLYSAWLQVGNLDGLRDTTYGRSLTLKLLLLVPLLLLAAFNLLIVTRRVRRGDQAAGTTWSRRFVTTIAVEGVLVIAVLFFVGRLIGQPPAREALADSSGRVAIDLEANGQAATLLITPGAAGPNHYRLELGSGFTGEPLPAETEAVLRLELPSHKTGQKEVDLTRAAGDAFEAHGSELGIAGDWRVEAIVRRPNTSDWATTASLSVDTDPPVAKLPGQPWRFSDAGIAGLALVVAGIGGLIAAWRTGAGRGRREAVGLGTTALLIGAVLLIQARVSPAGDQTAMAAPLDQSAIVRGQSLFAANCLSCHGATGKGDGPAAAGLSPPPADLTAAHARVHADADYAYWIANGMPGSAMPAFGDRLSEAEIADLVAYLRDLQSDSVAALDPPGPDECRVAPRTLEEMTALATADLPAVAVPEAGSGEPADSATVAEITATVRELAACTNAKDVMRRLALFSDANVKATFPDGPSAAFANILDAPVVPVPASAWVAVLAVQDPRLLPDGRAMAEIVIDNPATHTTVRPVPTPPRPARNSRRRGSSSFAPPATAAG